MIELKDLKEENLDDGFIEINNVSESGNVYHENGAGSLVFGVAERNIYLIDPSDKKQHADFTKGQLIVTVSDDTVRWRQEHEIGNIYEHKYLQEAKFVGDDAGQAMITALYNYLRGTFNIYTWDAHLHTKDDIVEEIVIDGKRNGTPSISVTSDDEGTIVKVSD